jgi:hypothetical protein
MGDTLEYLRRYRELYRQAPAPPAPRLTAADVLSRLEGVTAQPERGRNRWGARCPLHGGGQNDLAVWLSSSGHVRLKCRTGCQSYNVLKHLGLVAVKEG